MSWLFDLFAVRSATATKRRVELYARKLLIIQARNNLRAARRKD